MLNGTAAGIHVHMIQIDANCYHLSCTGGVQTAAHGCVRVNGCVMGLAKLQASDGNCHADLTQSAPRWQHAAAQPFSKLCII